MLRIRDQKQHTTNDPNKGWILFGTRVDDWVNKTETFIPAPKEEHEAPPQ